MSTSPFYASQTLQDSEVTTPATPADPIRLEEALILNDLITQPSLWQVHNCKITTLEITQEHRLPFLYHYDTLSDELKHSHPLTPQLLTQFNTPMFADEACQKLALPKGSIATPWQVKIVGTLVTYSETLQLALRLRFTNTAKAYDPIYVLHNADDQQHANTREANIHEANKQKIIQIAMRDWHFFGDVFVLNKQPKPLVVLLDDGTPPIEEALIYNVAKLADYQRLPNPYAVALLTQLDTHKSTLSYFDEAIQQRLG